MSNEVYICKNSNHIIETFFKIRLICVCHCAVSASIKTQTFFFYLQAETGGSKKVTTYLCTRFNIQINTFVIRNIKNRENKTGYFYRIYRLKQVSKWAIQKYVLLHTIKSPQICLPSKKTEKYIQQRFDKKSSVKLF